MRKKQTRMYCLCSMISLLATFGLLGVIRTARAAEVLVESSDEWGYTDKIVLIDPKEFNPDRLWELAALEMYVPAGGNQKLVVLKVLTEKRYPLFGVRSAFHLDNDAWLRGYYEHCLDKSAKALFIAFREGGIGWWIRYADGRIGKDVMGGDPWEFGEGDTAGDLLYVGHNAAVVGRDENGQLQLDEKGRLKRKKYPMFFIVQRGKLDLEAAEQYNAILRQRVGARNYSLTVSDNEWNPHLVGYPYYNPFSVEVGPPPKEVLERCRYISCAGIWPKEPSCSIVELTNSPR